jgi:hypothetical protein
MQAVASQHRFFGGEQREKQNVNSTPPLSDFLSLKNKKAWLGSAGATIFRAPDDPPNPLNPPNPVETSVIDAGRSGL